MKYCSFSNRTSDIITPSLELPISTPGVDRDALPGVFCRKFNSPQLLFEEFFDVSIIITIIRLPESANYQYQLIFVWTLP